MIESKVIPFRRLRDIHCFVELMENQICAIDRNSADNEAVIREMFKIVSELGKHQPVERGLWSSIDREVQRDFVRVEAEDSQWTL